MALAREVLGAGGQPGALHALDARGAVARDDRRILAVRADADVRAVALGEHVEARPEVEIDPETPELSPLDQPLTVRERLLARRADGEVVGKDRGAGATIFP